MSENQNVVEKTKGNQANIAIISIIVIPCILAFGFDAYAYLSTRGDGVYPDDPFAVKLTVADSDFDAKVVKVNGSTYTVSVDSYMGTNVMKITLDGSKISTISFDSVGDTPGIGDLCDDEDFLKQFVGQDVHKVKIDAKSGATNTSKSVLSCVGAVAEKVK